MSTVQITVAVLAFIVALASFLIAFLADRRSRKAEAVKELLGEKETVAFGALKIMRDGLPSAKKDRKLILSALLQACVFERSDRARALLYRVIEKNRDALQSEFDEAFASLEDTFKAMDRYGFTSEELDLSRGKRRIGTVRKVLEEKRLPPDRVATPFQDLNSD